MGKTKILLWSFSLIVFAGCLQAADKGLVLRAGYRNINDDVYNRVYRSGGYEAGLSFGFTVYKNLGVRLGGDFLTKKGKMSISKKRTSINLISFSAGPEYLVIKNKVIRVYVGGGCLYTKLLEKSELGETRLGKTSYYLEVGNEVALSQRFGFDVYIKYRNLIFSSFGETINLGGMSAGVGIVIR